MNPEMLALFIPTILAVSLTPGMCMTLAFTVGLTQGYRRTLWMMAGEMLGVAVVVTTTVLLLAWLLALDPLYFRLLGLAGGCYLLWIAWRLWTAEEHFSAERGGQQISRAQLAILGLTTAVMNPKGWAFMVALLPGFLDAERSISQQLPIFLGVMLTTEFLSMSLYAAGGRWLGHVLGQDKNLALLNKFAALLMVGVSVLVFT